MTIYDLAALHSQAKKQPKKKAIRARSGQDGLVGVESHALRESHVRIARTCMVPFQHEIVHLVD